jgi:inner membrane protein YidH
VLSTLRSWFDPTESHQVGEQPDYRYSLANERTVLAWLRTGLAPVGGGLAVAQFLSGAVTSEVLATVLLCLGGVVAVRAVDHWARAAAAWRKSPW